jgi:hypothetical protein
MSTATTNEARISVAEGPLVGPVLSRVIGMVAARAQCPVDRLDDALLIADAVAAAAPRHTASGRVVVDLEAGPDGITLSVRELEQGGADAVVADATLPGVGNVLERIASDVTSRTDADAGESVVIRIDFA